MTPEQKHSVENLLEEMSQEPRSCLLCGAATCNIGFWIPEGAKAKLILKIKEDKMRMLFYALCSWCQKKKGSIEEVEKQIYKDFCLQEIFVPSVDTEGKHYIEFDDGSKIYGDLSSDGIFYPWE